MIMADSLQSVLAPLVEQGLFGEGTYLSVKSDNDADFGLQFGGQVALVKLEVKTEKGQVRTLPIVVKFQMPDELQRRVRDAAAMFSNEVLMYKEILPYLAGSSPTTHPKLYHAVATCGEDWTKDILILENLKHSGYCISKQKLFLDYDHIAVSMKKAGELHAWSFTQKKRDGQNFINMVSKLKRPVILKDEEFDFEYVNFLSIKRGIKPFLTNSEYMDVLNDFLKVIEPVLKVTNLLYDADEPFGVILHGDYCKNNIFYKYDSSGKPVNCAYFDFQTAKYGSPVVDLAFFLYMHTTAETRKEHWDDFLEIYWKSVRENVPNDIELPSYEKFLDHFESKAVYGYIPCSFFVPNMLNEKPVTLDEFDSFTKEQKIDVFLTMGQEEGERRIVDIVYHLLEKNYIHKFLDYYKKKTKYLTS